MLDESARFSPDAYLQENHPDVRVYDVELSDALQGCLDHDRRIIWLAAGLSPVSRRCTLSFEIACLELGPTPSSPCLAAAHQRAAVDWAALMLISSADFAAAWGGCLDLATMAIGLEVDVATLRARIRAASDADQDAALAVIAQARADRTDA